MAQIIKHRRGSLESLSAVTGSLVKGEILIATGSSNLSVTNGASLVFAAPADGQVQAINRFLVGAAAPNTFSSATYNGMLKGVPYYASGSSTLYLLGEGANEIPNLVGNISAFSTSVDSRLDVVEASLGGGGSVGSSVTQLNSFTASAGIRLSNLESTSASVNTSISNIDTLNTLQTARLDLLSTYTGSNETAQTAQNERLGNLESKSASVDTSITSINSLNTLQTARLDLLSTYSGSNDTAQTVQNGRLSNLETTSASVNTSVTSINGHIADINTKTGSFETKFATIGTYTSSLDGHRSDINAYTASLRQAFTASGANVTFSGNVTIPGNLTVAGTQTIIDSTTIQIGDNILELNASGATHGGLLVKDATGLSTVSGSLLWDTTNDIWKVGKSGSESQILTVGGMNVVSASAQINFTELSGISANIISGSSDTANVDMIITGGSISANLKGGVVSGSSQITISDTTGYSTFSSSIATNVVELFGTASNHEGRLDTIEASVGGGGSVSTRIDQLAAATASVNSFTSSTLGHIADINAYTASNTTTNTAQSARLTNLETTSASVNTSITSINGHIADINAYTASNTTTNTAQNARLTNLETTSASVDTLNALQTARLDLLSADSGSQNTRITDLETKATTLATYTASVNGHIADINAYTASNDTAQTAQNGRLSNIETFTSSFGTTFSSSVDSRLDALEGTGTIQGVGTGNNVTFASATTTGNMTIGGDLVVQGNTVTLNTATLIVEDKTIQLASGSANAAASNGAGIEIMGANATFTYDSTPNAWTANIPISASAFTGSFNLPAGGSSKRVAFRTAAGNLDLVGAPTTTGDILQWDGSDFVMSNTIDGGSF